MSINEFFTDLLLSTITVESKISNIKFKENELIPKLSFDVLSLKEQEKYKDIIKIGCNYQEFITDKYIELTTPVKKSNRGRKKKIKPVSNRKVQGNGKYFNSQITFTILDAENKNKFYHLKLFDHYQLILVTKGHHLILHFALVSCIFVQDKAKIFSHNHPSWVLRHSLHV